MKRFSLLWFYQKARINFYRLFSNYSNITGSPLLIHPCIFKGSGKIIIKKNVRFGVLHSPYLLNGYSYIEARNIQSNIVFESNVWINNNACIISEGGGIFIGKNTISGTNLQIYDSDFHNINPVSRKKGNPVSKKVVIKENVFIGSNVTILKGVTIGANSVIGNSSVLTKSIPDNVIAAGNPAKIIKEIEAKGNQ